MRTLFHHPLSWHSLALISTLAVLACVGCGNEDESSEIRMGNQDSTTFPSDAADTGTSDSVRNRAAEVSFTDVEGVTFTLAEYRGAVIMVDFLRTDTEHSVERIQTLKELLVEFRPAGFQIVCIAMDMVGKEELRRLGQRYKVPFPLVQGASIYNLDPWLWSSLPVTYLYDRDGRPVTRIVGPEKKEVYEKQIKSILDNT